MIEIEDILKNVTKSYDHVIDGTPEGWVHFLKWKFCPSLATDMMENGQIDPISIEIHGDGAWEQGNGHHRLACAIMLGWDEILVQTDVCNWETNGIESSGYWICDGD